MDAREHEAADSLVRERLIAEPLLAVRDLQVDYSTPHGTSRAIESVSFDIQRGETVAVVGESGSGKTSLALAMLGLLPKSARATGSVLFDGQELLSAPRDVLRLIRGRKIAMVFQDALAALNPMMTVGAQVVEAIMVHQDVTRRRAREYAIDLLMLVGLDDASSRVDQYPHEYSGGMRQRAVIAMAIANEPDLLIADEPTTALDATVQAQVLDTLERVRDRTSSAILLVTHDLGVVAGMADRMVVMYAGRQVEQGTVDELFYTSRHPYTLGLLESRPRLDRRVASGSRLHRIAGRPASLSDAPAGCAFHPRCHAGEVDGRCVSVVPDLRSVEDGGLRGDGDFGGRHWVACHRAQELDHDALLRGEVRTSGAAAAVRALANERSPVLEVRDLVKDFPVRSRLLRRNSGVVRAVGGISFIVNEGETFALVGESGCGKSTTARIIVNLMAASSGSVRYRGEEVLTKTGAELRQLRSRLQIMFQDPYSSLDPRMTIEASIAEPLHIHGRGAGAREHARQLMTLVDLDPSDGPRMPSALSGGQRQRVSLARALALEPDVLVLDEPVSALDVSVQAGVLNLLDDLQDRLGLAYVLIAHDLAVIRHSADTVAVMYGGRIVEIGPNDAVFSHAGHPYTQALLSAVPIPDPRAERERSLARIVLKGDQTSSSDAQRGCVFRARCWKATDLCTEVEPVLSDDGQGHAVACHFRGERDTASRL